MILNQPAAYKYFPLRDSGGFCFKHPLLAASHMGYFVIRENRRFLGFEPDWGVSSAYLAAAEEQETLQAETVSVPSSSWSSLTRSSLAFVLGSRREATSSGGLLSQKLVRKCNAYSLGDQMGRPKCAEGAGRCPREATIVFERSWRSGEIPDGWEKAGALQKQWGGWFGRL